MTKARRFGPNGDPGSSPAGGSALKRLEQQGHTPPCSDTRVTSGAIRGISTRSYSSQTICVTPDTSAPQPLQVAASTARFAVGLGCSGRCAPRCGLAFALGAEAPDGFCPFDGGTLELSGVFGGSPSLTSSSATRAASAAFSATSASWPATNASIRAISAAINASLSCKSRGESSIRGLIFARPTQPKTASSPTPAENPQTEGAEQLRRVGHFPRSRCSESGCTDGPRPCGNL